MFLSEKQPHHVENMGPKDDQLVPVAMPRYGAVASRRIGGTCRNRGFPYVHPSVRDDDASWSYILTFPRFRVKKQIASTARTFLANPYPREVRNTVGSRRRRRRRLQWRFYRSHAERQRACACATRSACGTRSRILLARALATRVSRATYVRPRFARHREVRDII